MKNITLALAIALGFCATEAEAQTSTRLRRNLLGGRNTSAVEKTEMTPEEIRERELWLTWPNDVGWDNTNIVKLCAEKLNVVLLGWESSGGFGGKIVCYGGDDGGWMNGCGKCIIDSGDGGAFWKKFNSDGILIQAGRCECFAEYIWMTNRAECATVENRKKWANEHGMSYDAAILKYNNPAALRKRRRLRFEAEAEKARIAVERERERAQREAEKEAERAEREKEREETQKKLAEMAEELKRQREAAAEKREAEKHQ